MTTASRKITQIRYTSAELVFGTPAPNIRPGDGIIPTGSRARGLRVTSVGQDQDKRVCRFRCAVTSEMVLRSKLAGFDSDTGRALAPDAVPREFSQGGLLVSRYFGTREELAPIPIGGF